MSGARNGDEREVLFQPVPCAGQTVGVQGRIRKAMEKDRWDADQAFKEMKKYDFGFDFLHPEFKQFVFAYNPQHDRFASASVPDAKPEVASAQQ